MKYISNIFVVLSVLVLTNSCKKFLEEIPDKKLAIPSTLGDLQSILDNFATMNNQSPVVLEIMSDNQFVRNDQMFNAVTDETTKDLYKWQRNESNNWSNLYDVIFTANTILDNLPGISYNPATEQGTWNSIKGSALFFRAYNFYFCSQIFGQPFDKNTSGQDLGIVLRLNSDFNEVSMRSTVKQSYDQIISDFREAISLLPEKTALKTRPTRAAAFGALSRTYLAMQEYDSAGKYADLCIQHYGGVDSLLNFNNNAEVNVTATIPFPLPMVNKEIIFHYKGGTIAILSNARTRSDSNLYKSYAPNDRRKAAYYKTDSSFKGDYGASGTQGYTYGGIVLDEMFLIRAESYARKGDKTNALIDLNALMAKRCTTFVNITAVDANDALNKILVERRKELIFRGTRWVDLRRLMKEPQFAVTPRRFVNGQFYELLPNSPRYTVLIPAQVIALSGIQQNQ
ncbi:MAG TPA: RagB/SusD family nutrient uptake outer membrane protein [Chitinophagaceae bacterium]|nr:RagB/SusD family nutrient uptake outer membrane protein [Chitinophagaceae bacterium]